MKYYTISPPPSLAGLVRFFWVFEGNDSAESSYVYRSLADGCAELIFHYKGIFEELTDKNIIKHPNSHVHGQSQKFRRFVTNDSFGIFGAYLYPFAIPQFFSMPSTELSNQLPDFHSLLGTDGKELEEKIMLAKTNLHRAAILSLFLENRLKKCKKQEPAVFSSISYIIHSKGTTNVKELAEKYCLSIRQFERKFKEYSGFSPKLFSRITRFQAAIKEYGNKGKSLTEIAYECGYYDQSHFINDFKEFSGYHPKFYFSGRAEGTEYRN